MAQRNHLHNVAVYDHEVNAATLAGLRLIFLTGQVIPSETFQAVANLVKQGATCVLPPRLTAPESDLASIQEITLVPDSAGQWLFIPEFYRLHYESFCAGPIIPLLREILQPLIGDGDTLVYNFGKYQARIRQDGWDYPRHEIMTWNVPLTQYGANPDRFEFEITQE